MTALEKYYASLESDDTITEDTICIYHGNCPDGFTSAWIVERSLGVKEDIFYHPGVYQQDPPNVIGKNVIIVDFSYMRPVMEKIIKDAKSVIVLDHHTSAQKELKGLEGAEIIFDMDKSGARITWDYFHPNEEVPSFVKYVEDRDLFRFALPKTNEVHLNTTSYEYEFSNWDLLNKMSVEDAIADGTTIKRKFDKDLNEMIEMSSREVTIGGHTIMVANLPRSMSSDGAGLLSIGLPLGAAYMDGPNGRLYSLRSNDKGVDVSEVAKQYGGGGHKHASGFTISFEEAAKLGL